MNKTESVQLSVMSSLKYATSEYYPNASGESEAAVTVRTRIGWIKFRKRGKSLCERFPLKLKGKIIRVA